MRPKRTLNSFRLIQTFAYLLASALCCGLLTSAHAQTNFQRLKSFGFPDLAGNYPLGAPIEGSDGALYGTTTSGGPDGVGTAYKLKEDGTASILHVFRLRDGGGSRPSPGLVEANDGALYGTTTFGGDTNIVDSYGLGTVFRLSKDGSGYTVLHHFSRTGGDGFGPEAALMEGTDGALFGTTAEGGASNVGTVFKLNKDGSGYAVLRSFCGEDGRNPRAALIEGSDSALYGSTGGGSNGAGTLFKLNTDGNGYALLHKFTGSADGWGPAAALVRGSNGALYGTTVYGGANDVGTVFKLNSDRSSYSVLHSFSPTGPDGHNPEAALVQGSDGAFYGTTHGGDGGWNPPGTVFKLNADGSGYTVIHSFIANTYGSVSGLVLGSDKALYGTTATGGTGGGMVFKLNNDGSGYSIVRSFGRSGGDGAVPQAAMVEGSNGAFYGTTSRGGTNDAGTVFKLNQEGSGYTVLHSFSGEDAHPLAGLVQGSDGKLYGTSVGGSGYRDDNNNVGTAFKLNQDGSDYTLLHNFNTNGVDGLEPAAALIQGTDGALYGTASHGGTTNANDPLGFGTVFKLNKDGNGYTVLHGFGSSETDGQNPKAGLIEATDGVLYGTTKYGGSNFLGTVFKLNKDGSGYSVLSHLGFDGGYWPSAGLLEGQDGILYGTTDEGGSNQAGTVFKINKDGSGYTRLLSLDGTPSFHGNPVAGLVEGIDGALYGTTCYGGVYPLNNTRFWNGSGTVFKLNKDGSGYTKLRSFSGEDGCFPVAALVQGKDGALYGTTSSGGDLGFGTVFRLFTSTPVISFERIESSGAGSWLSLSGGAAGQTFQIQATANLNTTAWQTIGTNQFGIDGKSQFLDTGASNYPTRFYQSATP